MEFKFQPIYKLGRTKTIMKPDTLQIATGEIRIDIRSAKSIFGDDMKGIRVAYEVDIDHKAIRVVNTTDREGSFTMRPSDNMSFVYSTLPTAIKNLGYPRGFYRLAEGHKDAFVYDRSKESSIGPIRDSHTHENNDKLKIGDKVSFQTTMDNGENIYGEGYISTIYAARNTTSLIARVRVTYKPYLDIFPNRIVIKKTLSNLTKLS